MISSGKFMLIGGGPAARTNREPFMTRLVQEAGGNNSRITILTAGSEEPQWANADYWDILTEMGLKNLYAPKINSRKDADDQHVAERIASSQAVYIAGGSQATFMAKVADTLSEKAMQEVLRQGGLIAGTSSGASVVADVMILTGGTENKHLRQDMIEVGRGFGMLSPNIAIDTHCSSRGRLPRNVALLMKNPQLQIIGLDEDTAIFIKPDGICQVFGFNAVYILDGLGSSTSSLKITNVKLHCLTNGNRYNLNNRQPI